jgi:aminoglycoside phosphotransferase (APT) family kinase protein
VAQIRARLDDVYSVHPSFAEAVARVGPLCIPSFDDLLERVSRLDVTLPAPFTVLIHGDCNVDNLIWVAEENRIRFIDVYRSRWMDWTQDASVFIVSSLRLQVFSRPLRRRIRRVVSEYARQVDVWAQESGDLLYRPRLTLGLARSFATSARFVLDEAFARSLFLRARYLVDRLAQEVDDLSTFSLPLEDLFE